MNLRKEIRKPAIDIERLNFIFKYCKNEDFLFELHNIAIDQGFSSVAQKAEMNRESLYKILDPNAKPYWDTLIKVLKAMGLELELKKIDTNCKISDFEKSIYELRNSLAHFNLKIASEWHTEKNHGESPNYVTPTSRKKVWWKCGNGHEWSELIITRSKGKNCPFCEAINLINKLI